MGGSVAPSTADPAGAVCLEGNNEIRVHCHEICRESRDSGRELCNGSAVTRSGFCYFCDVVHRLFLEVNIIQVCGGFLRGAVGGTRLVLNQEAPLPLGSGENHFETRESLFNRRLLVPLPTISSENACVEHKLVGVVHNLLGRVGCGAGVDVCGSVINMTTDDFNGVSGGVCLAEALVVHDPVCVGDDGIGLVEVGKYIKSAGSAMPSVRPMFYLNEVVLNGAYNLFPKGAVYVQKGVESKRGYVLSVVNGFYFGSSGACQDDRRRSGIGRGHDPCY